MFAGTLAVGHLLLSIPGLPQVAAHALGLNVYVTRNSTIDLQPLAVGDELVVRNPLGSVKVVGIVDGRQPRIEMLVETADMTKEEAVALAEQVALDVTQSAPWIVAVTPPPRTRTQDVRADLVLHVPTQIRLKFDDIAGDVYLERMHGDVFIDKNNGTVHLAELSGNVRAHVRYGTIIGSDITGDVTLNGRSLSVDLHSVTGKTDIVSEEGRGMNLLDMHGPVTVRTEGSWITAERLHGPTSIITSRSSVDIQGAADTVAVQTTLAPIRFSTDQLTGDIVLTNADADIFVELPQVTVPNGNDRETDIANRGYRIDLEAVAGMIRWDGMDDHIEFGDGRQLLEQTIGGTAEEQLQLPIVQVKTSNGNITGNIH